MSLTNDQVRHVARLARLGIEESEVTYFAGQLSLILEHIERMGQLDTESVPPTAQPSGSLNVLADDVVGASLPREEALANAPAHDQAFFLVKAIAE